MHRRALAASEKALGAESPDTAASLSALAELLDGQGAPALPVSKLHLPVCMLPGVARRQRVG